MARKPRVAIIGGGIGGLATALALHRRGLEFSVYEQAPHLTEIGGGLNLSPNALKAFRFLGIENEAIQLGVQTDFQTVRSWRSGRLISRLERGAGVAKLYGASFLTMHRADLRDVLGNALPEDRITLNTRCSGVETRGTVAVARFADGSEIEADVIVGADGIHSSVRESLFAGAVWCRSTRCRGNPGSRI